MSHTVEILITAFVLYSIFMWVSLVVYTHYFTSVVKNLITLVKPKILRNPHKHCRYALDMIDGIACEHINNKKAFDQVMLALETLDNNLGDDCDGKK